MGTHQVLAEVAAERKRHVAAGIAGKLAVDCSAAKVEDMRKLPVLAEEFGEVARALHEGDHANMRVELIQVAAVAVAWAEALK